MKQRQECEIQKTYFYFVPQPWSSYPQTMGITLFFNNSCRMHFFGIDRLFVSSERKLLPLPSLRSMAAMSPTFVALFIADILLVYLEIYTMNPIEIFVTLWYNCFKLLEYLAVHVEPIILKSVKYSTIRISILPFLNFMEIM